MHTILVQELVDHKFLDDLSGLRHWNTRRTNTLGLEICVGHTIDDGRDLLFSPTSRRLDPLLVGDADTSHSEDTVMDI